MKKLKFLLLYLSLIIFISLSILPMHFIQAMEESLITITDGKEGGINMILPINLNSSLKDLRLLLIKENVISDINIFQNNKRSDIIKSYEDKIKISKIIDNETLYIKYIPSIFNNATSPAHKSDASKHRQTAGFNINHSSFQVNESLKEETSVAPTQGIVFYNDLLPENCNFIFDSLKLKSAINLKEKNIETSFRTSVTWGEQYPDFRFPVHDLTVNREFSLSKILHELKKSNITTVTAGVSYLGISVDTEYQSKNESLSRREETEIYLLATYNVKKVELSINKRFIMASLELEQELKEVLRKQGIDSYKGLIDIFDEYGFCVPTTFVLGGLIYCEDKKRVTSQDEATEKATSFAASLEASISGIGISARAGGSYGITTSSRDASASVQQSVNKLVTGGDIGLANDPVKWMSSMGPIRSWRVIQYGGFFPIIDFLKPELKEQCKNLIKTYYKNDWEKISLQALQAAFEEEKKIQRVIMKYGLTMQYEQDYREFYNGRLIYKLNANDDFGKVELRVADLINPLEGTFDLSNCHNINNYLSISTGYRKMKKDENKNKVEIWFTPRFLVEKGTDKNAQHFREVFSNSYFDTIPFGIFWNWGNQNDLDFDNDYHYHYHYILGNKLGKERKIHRQANGMLCDAASRFMLNNLFTGSSSSSCIFEVSMLADQNELRVAVNHYHKKNDNNLFVDHDNSQICEGPYFTFIW